MQNKKLAILIILIIVAIIVWMPKGKRKQQISPKPVPVSLEKVVLGITPVQRKRTGFTEWGRNPFIWYREGPGALAGLTLSGIVWDNEASYAVINGAIVHAGDEIAGKTIKRIESDKVILSDDLRDYVLKLE